MKIRRFVLLVIVAFASQALALGEASAAAPAAATLPSKRDPNPEPIVVPAGTTLVLVFESTVSSASAQVGDLVIARLGDDVKNGEETLLRAGSEMRGRVTSVKRSGKVKGKAELHVEFETIEVKGRSYKIEGTPVDEKAKPSKGRDAKIIGGVAGAGAIIGGVAGGGAGLLKGFLIGGAAGTGGVLLTRGREVVFEQGSRHSVTLESSLRLR
jgi:hypothetical protein